MILKPPPTEKPTSAVIKGGAGVAALIGGVALAVRKQATRAQQVIGAVAALAGVALGAWAIQEYRSNGPERS